MFNNDQYGPLEFNMAIVPQVQVSTIPEKTVSYLPPSGFVRLSIILGNKKSDPQIFPLIPVCKSTWWDGVKSGRFPKPIKFGPRITAWRVEDIRALIEKGMF